jgi:hypothetical protein
MELTLPESNVFLVVVQYLIWYLIYLHKNKTLLSITTAKVTNTFVQNKDAFASSFVCILSN